MKKPIFVILFLTAVMMMNLLTGCNSQEEERQIKVALLVQGPANDNGWNQSALNGVNLIGEKLGAEVSVSENLDLSDFEEFFMNYGKQKYDIVFGHGYAFADAALNVAADYPETYFIITSADIAQEPNVASVKNNSYHQGFLSGAFAALYSETGKVGIVGGMEIPSIISWLEGAEKGIAYIGNNVSAISSYTGNFEDSIAAKEMALAMIEQGADILLQNLDPAGIGVLEACKEQDVAYIGSILDQYELAPEVVVTSGLSDLSQSMLQMAELIQSGDIQIQTYEMGIAEGVVSLAPWKGVWEERIPQEITDYMNRLVEDIQSGSVQID